MSDSKQATSRERIIQMIHLARKQTIDNGATPGEAAKFAARVAKWIEEYQIKEAELHTEPPKPEDFEVIQDYLRTGKKVFNPGVTAVVNGLAVGMCCKTILLHVAGEAMYGVVGEQFDVAYVIQMATTVIPLLQGMAREEGIEHGHEKQGLVRWGNQYLTGAGDEIRKRLEAERKQRSEEKEVEHKTHGTAMICVTGQLIAESKKQATEVTFKEFYPKTIQKYSKSSYDHTAREQGRAAGRRVGLHQNLPEAGVNKHLT